MISFDPANADLMYEIGIKYQYASRTVCTCAHVFQKQPRCALIRACALIRTNTVHVFAEK